MFFHLDVSHYATLEGHRSVVSNLNYLSKLTVRFLCSLREI